MNDIEEIWNRILAHCSTDSLNPEYIFTTITGIKFYIKKNNENTIHPYRIDKSSKLYDITKIVIKRDLDIGRPKNGETPVDYGIPAPSYRYGLLNDNRIYY